MREVQAEEAKCPRSSHVDGNDVQSDTSEYGEPILDFQVSVYELVQLFKHWVTVLLRSDFFNFRYAGYAPSSWRIECVAGKRVDQLAEALGSEAAKAAMEEAYEEFGKSQDRRIWNLFVNGESLPERIVHKLARGEKVTAADWREPKGRVKVQF
jgi:hypothetical protein